jgi:hypothetical protein
MKQWCAAIAVGAFMFVVLGAPQRALADKTTATTIFHSAQLAVTTASQTVATDTMLRRSCVGWYFENQSGTATAFLNLNADTTAAVAGSYADQLVLAPGEWREIEVHRITQFKAIGDAALNLYWSCICHSS